jgi:hypothetical protein
MQAYLEEKAFGIGLEGPFLVAATVWSPPCGRPTPPQTIDCSFIAPPRWTILARFDPGEAIRVATP